MSYSKTIWTNGSGAKINETNLNKIEQGIYDNDSAIGDISYLDTTATDLVGAVNEINERKTTLLWENSNPYSTFSSTTIELSSGDYDFLEIYYNNYNNEGFKQLHCIKIPKGYNGMMNANFVNQNYVYISMRDITYTDETHLLIHSGLGRWLNNQNWTAETQNNTCIPFRVYGIK